MYKFCPYCGDPLTQLDESTFQCQGCQKKLFLNSKPTAGIVPVFEDQMLVAVRAIEPQKGKLDAIGGFLNYGEEPKLGAIRELEEETGLRVSEDDLELIGITVDSYLFEGTTAYTFNAFYKLVCQEKLVMNPADDVAELRWVPIEGELDWGFESLKQIPEMLLTKQS